MDLGAWANEEYAIAGPQATDMDIDLTQEKEERERQDFNF